MFISDKVAQIKITGNTSITDIALALDKYGVSTKNGLLRYKDLSFKILFNNGKVTLNRFRECSTFEVTNGNTVFPEGKLTINFTQLDRMLSKIDTMSGAAKSRKRALDFKLQLFKPYFQQVIIDSYPFASSELTITDDHNDDRMFITVKDPFMAIGFIVQKRPYNKVVDKEMDEIELTLITNFGHQNITPITKTVNAWKECLPNLFTVFKNIVSDVNEKARAKQLILERCDVDVRKLEAICNQEKDLLRRKRDVDIRSPQCVSIYNFDYMENFVAKL